MSVITYSIKKYGRDYKISPSFKLGEMACKDGSDTVLVSQELMKMLEQLRSYVGGTITISSGYRTAAHNKKVGGAASSQHLFGTAADIIVKRNGIVIPAKKICCLCQYLGFKGVGFINNNSVHVDMRTSGSYRGDERKGYSGNVGGNFFTYFGLQVSDILALKVKEPEPETQKQEVEEEVTQEQFDKFMENWLEARAKKSPASWSKTDREWAEKNGIIKGTGNGMEYQSYVTREQMVAFLHREHEL